MNSLFEISYVILGVLILVEAMIIRNVLQEMLRLKELFFSSDPKVLEGPRTGDEVPAFQANVMGTNATFTVADLIGNPAMLLFISADASPQFRSEELTVAIPALWHKVDGKLYLVCKGTEQQCRRFVESYQLQNLGHHAVKVLVDETGEVATTFSINAMPRVVMLDARGRVSKTARPLSPDEVGALEAAREIDTEVRTETLAASFQQSH